MAHARAIARHWRALIVAGGFLALLGASAAIYFLGPKPPQFSSERQYQQDASYRPGGPGCDLQRLNGLKNGKPTAERQRCTDAQEQYRLQINSVEEARRAAKAGEEAAWQSYEQARFTAYGVTIGCLTLLSAIFAVIFASKSIAETRRIGEAQVRAYLVVSRAWIKVSGNRVWILPEIKNSGQSPALKVKLHYTKIIANAGIVGGTSGGSYSEQSETIPAGEARKVTPWRDSFGLSQAQVEAWRRGGLPIQAVIDVKGEDVFERPLHAKATFIAMPGVNADGKYRLMGTISEFNDAVISQLDQLDRSPFEEKPDG